MSEKDRELTEFEKDVQAAFAIASREIEEFIKNDYIEVQYDSFIRSGLAIIHGVIKGEIPPAAWLHYTNGSHQEVWVKKGEELLLKIPPVFEHTPTVVFSDVETPSFFNFVADIGLNRKDNPEEFEQALSLRLKHSFVEMPPNVQLLVKLNTLFEANGFSIIKISDFVTDAEDVTPTESDSVAVEPSKGNDNAFDEGELL